MRVFSKQELIDACIEIRDMGWIESTRPGNAGGVGNTLEDLLGIEENNLPIANATEWELKVQRAKTTALVSFFHLEPSPTALRFVPQIFLPNYGWPHQEAGKKYPPNELSFRQTINAANRSNRGFGVTVDRSGSRVVISFDASSVGESQHDWLKTVEQRIGLGELDPQPYWGFEDLFHKAATKLHNCFFLKADVSRKKVNGKTKEFFHYNSLQILTGLDLNRFVAAIENGYIYIDFDARTGHNHGTKFRLRSNRIPDLYGHAEKLF